MFKVVKNRKRSGYVDRQHGHIECPKSVFLLAKATHFEVMITTVNEVISEKTKVLMDLLSETGASIRDCVI